MHGERLSPSLHPCERCRAVQHVTKLLLSLFSYGEALFMNSKLISGVTEFLNTDKELSEVNTPTHMHIVQALQ